MKYTYTCPANDGFVAMVEASNDDEAVDKLATQTRAHMVSLHPDMASMSPDQTRDMVRRGMKKE